MVSQYMATFGSSGGKIPGTHRARFADPVTDRLPDFMERFFAKDMRIQIGVRTAVANLQQSMALMAEVLAEESGEDPATWQFHQNLGVQIWDVPRDLLRQMMEQEPPGT